MPHPESETDNSRFISTIFKKANAPEGIDLRTLDYSTLQTLLDEDQLKQSPEGRKLIRMIVSLISSKELVASRHYPKLKSSLHDESKWIFKLPLVPFNDNQ